MVWWELIIMEEILVTFGENWGYRVYIYWNDEVYSIQHYVIKFISDLQQIGGFLQDTPISSSNNTWPPRYSWIFFLLKVALNAITVALTIEGTICNYYIFACLLYWYCIIYCNTVYYDCCSNLQFTCHWYSIIYCNTFYYDYCSGY